MESQDGISVRSMRLKVLYTFDDENKTNCLARWPHLLDIQTAYLDEQTQIGVIELKTCIQAIVSASPELVAKLGQDYTVYAYDYSEYETPLVGQGMLSWVLASASPTPNAPAHQSRTIVTGRVCKNVLGLFSKGAQETLEVKLRLVPVPTVMQSEYLTSMQKYRELSKVIPQEFDARAWTSFIQQNPGLFAPNKGPQVTDRTTSPLDASGIEKFHQLLSEGSTPREFPTMHGNEPFQAGSPAQSTFAAAPSRDSTPSGFRPTSSQQTKRGASEAFRPSSRTSTRDGELQRHPSYSASRRGSVQSGYGSSDEIGDQQPRKRAKLYRADGPSSVDMNIERQSASLRVAASTAASVRIHRPTPVNPAVASARGSNEEPIRPPTPISGPDDMPRRVRPAPSLLREASSQSTAQYNSPYAMSDDRPSAEPNAHSPEEVRYHGIFEPSISMPSSPPIVDSGFPNRSSPVLPPVPMDPDSGFMSGTLEDLLDDDTCLRTNMDDDVVTPGHCRKEISSDTARNEHTGASNTQETSPVTTHRASVPQHDNYLASDGPAAPSPKDSTPTLPARRAGSRPSSRASARQPPKPLAPAPMSQSEIEQLMSAIPASDPVLQHSHSWNGPMSDFSAIETPAPLPVDDGKVRSGAGARRVKQVQARLDKCIRDGQVPPFCENCGAIETPTWRRAWSKEMEGSEQEANDFARDNTILFWQVVERDQENKEKVIKFKVFKKTLADTDNDYVQVLLCNPCGLWLHKFKHMRPENKWNKPAKDKRKRATRHKKGPLSGGGNTATRGRSRTEESKPPESSPGRSDASSPAAEEGITPNAENDRDNNEEQQDGSSSRRRANSVEPRGSTDTSQRRWQEQDAIEALRRAIQSSPARNLQVRNVAASEENLTPKPVRRNLFPNAQDQGAMKMLGDSLMNSPRRSPRVASQNSAKESADKENHHPVSHDDLDDLFESPTFEFDPPASPTPRRRGGPVGEKRLSLPLSPTPGNGRAGSSRTTPSKSTSESLQRVQGASPGSTPRGPKPSKQFGSNVPKFPSLHGNSPHSRNYEVIDGMIMDIFDEDAASITQTDSFDPFEPPKNWVDWIPSDYVSPGGSEAGQQRTGQGRHFSNPDESDDLINAILSDPAVHKANLHNSQFGHLLFDGTGEGENQSGLFDSAFFSSDSPNEHLTSLGVKDAGPNGPQSDKENKDEASASTAV
ncbi:hypothetical protein DTO282F9_6337 [Paecilomyces variotii]|nr:hypothetical protein DTO282F9_6337 [Paecilomyces variotii]